MTKSKQQLFEEELGKLYAEFANRERKDESDESIASDLLDLILQRERLRQGIVAGTPEASDIDATTLKLMSTWDSDDPRVAVLEKTMRKLALGDNVAAIRYLRISAEQKLNAFREEQRERARTPREPHPVDMLIERIVLQNPKITERGLYNALRKQVGAGVIAAIDEREIEPEDDKVPTIKLSGLKDRLYRARKKLSREPASAT
jgi:hypothetical protein